MPNKDAKLFKVKAHGLIVQSLIVGFYKFSVLLSGTPFKMRCTIMHGKPDVLKHEF